MLVRAHEGWLRAWLRSKLYDWTAADDLAQDAFVTAFLKIREFKKFQSEGSFEAWLRTIALNHFRNHLRKKREEYVGGHLELQALLTPDDTDETTHGNTSLNALRECMKLVKEPGRKLLSERYTLGKTLREIAIETGVGYSSLTMTFHRLRQSLSECIELRIRKETL